MATPEGRVKEVIKKLLKAHKCWYFMPVMNGMGKTGVPDILTILPNGRFCGIETKAGKNKPTELQTRCINDINDAGGIALWVNETTTHLVEEIIHANSTQPGSNNPKTGQPNTGVKLHTNGETLPL